MSKKIFVVYGHYNTKKSFNAEVRNVFIKEAKKLGHQIDLINLHEEKPIPFYDGSEPSEQILDYRKISLFGSLNWFNRVEKLSLQKNMCKQP